jgi:hypothetical protein
MEIEPMETEPLSVDRFSDLYMQSFVDKYIKPAFDRWEEKYLAWETAQYENVPLTGYIPESLCGTPSAP